MEVVVEQRLASSHKTLGKAVNKLLCWYLLAVNLRYNQTDWALTNSPSKGWDNETGVKKLQQDLECDERGEVMGERSSEAI